MKLLTPRRKCARLHVKISKHRKNTLLFFPLFARTIFLIAIKTMADEDVDCLPNDEDDPPMSTRKRRRESSGAEEGLPAKRSPVRLPGTIEEVVALQKKLSKQLMGHSLAESLSLRVVNAALQLQREHLQETSRNGGTELSVTFSACRLTATARSCCRTSKEMEEGASRAQEATVMVVCVACQTPRQRNVW